MAQGSVRRPLPSQSPNQSTRRRPLLLIVLLLAAVVGLALIWRSNMKSSAAPAPARHHRLVAVRTGKGKHARVHYKQVVTKKKRVSPLAQYAGNLIPVLDQSRATFDAATAAVNAQSSSLSSLGEACAWWSSRITIEESQADGVPHPYTWYTRVGNLHHSIMGTYNDILGGMDNCNAATAAGDPDAAATALNDIGAADHAMRRTDDYVRWLSHHG